MMFAAALCTRRLLILLTVCAVLAERLPVSLKFQSKVQTGDDYIPAPEREEFQVDSSCPNGVQHLKGDVRIPEGGITFARECVLIGDDGARIELDGPINGKQLNLLGHIAFWATRPFSQACLSLDILTVNGTVFIENCRNQVNEAQGGCASVRGLRIGPTGDLTFRHCYAKSDGGGLASGDQGVQIHGGALRFHRCTAEEQGGGLFARGDLTMQKGLLEFTECGHLDSCAKGGALAAKNAKLVFRDAKVRAEDCAASEGGAFYLEDSELKQEGGQLKIERSLALRAGGGMSAKGGQLSLKEGSMVWEHCSLLDGGELEAYRKKQAEAEKHAEDESEDEINPIIPNWLVGDDDEDEDDEAQEDEESHAGHHSMTASSFLKRWNLPIATNASLKQYAAGGGGLSVQGGQVYQEGGTLRFYECRAQDGGGLALVEGKIHQIGGLMSFVACKSNRGGRGGGMFAQQVAGGFSGNVSFMNCQAVSRGGGLSLHESNLTLDGADVKFDGCQADLGNVVTVKKKKGRRVSKYQFADGGGLAVEGGQVQQRGGNLTFAHCRAVRGGGLAILHTEIQQHAGLILFSGCVATHGGGGMMAIEGQVLLEGQLRFEQCTADASREDSGHTVNTNGGAMHLIDTEFKLEDANVQVRKCSAGRGGGFALIKGEFTQHGGHLLLEDCIAYSNGGGIALTKGIVSLAKGTMEITRVRVAESEKPRRRFGGGFLVEAGHVYQHDGVLKFTQCESAHGGGIAVKSGEIKQRGGFLSFSNCTAGMSGGGIMAINSQLLMKGNVSLHNCKTALDDKASPSTGGGMALKSSNFTLKGARVNISACASDLGGGLFLEKGLLAQDGILRVANCTASQGGGGFYVLQGAINQRGAVSFESCVTELGGGGGLAVEESAIVQSDGILKFDKCTSQGQGGAVYLRKISVFQQDYGVLSISKCTAEEGGGMSFVESELKQQAGTMDFRGCLAHLSGGGLHFSDQASLRQTTGFIRFQNCQSKAYGGCLSMEAGHSIAANGTMSFENCSARMKPALYALTEHTRLSTAIFVNAKSLDQSDHTSVFTTGVFDIGKLEIPTAWEESFGVSADEIRVQDPLNCSAASQDCSLHGLNLQVPNILCARGTGLNHVPGKSVSCLPCKPNHMQLMDSVKASCRSCPFEGIFRCEPGEIQLQKGFMAEVLDNLNEVRVHHCLNSQACPGGVLPGSQTMPMCKDGYHGNGCLQCDAGHATSDADVLSCTRCARDFAAKALQFGTVLLKDVLIFLIAYSGGLGAVDDLGNQKDAKTSSILLNQLMAFGSVASIAVVSAMNTASAQDLREKLGTAVWNQVRSIIGLTEFTPGEASGSMSTQCMVSYLGLPPSAWMAQLVSSVVPLLLVLSFAVGNDPALAAIVGSNCFLPVFCASFSKYLVFFRTEKGSSKIEFKDLPDIFTPLAGFLTFGFAILLCFVVAIVTWTRASLSSENAKIRPHVAYLRRPYREGCSVMELERLSRKMVLKTIAAALPITAYPVLQLTFVIIVLLFPLTLYAFLKPYKKPWLNLSEIALIIAAVIMVCLANLMSASESHWATTGLTQMAVLVLLMLIATVSSFTLAILIGRFMYAEFRGNVETDEVDDVH